MNDSENATMLELRDATRGDHDRAEHHRFQQALVRGELDRQRYAAWLGQMYLIHQVLEAALREIAAGNESVRTVVRDYQYQVPYLLEDLRFFGVDPTQIEPTPAVDRFTTLVGESRDNAIRLLGLHYVLEGSNNGGRFIARHVGKAYDLAPGPGLQYLDPYGDRQREYWTTFKDDMSSIDFSPEQSTDLVQAAKQMYQTVAELSDDLAEPA